MRNAVLVFLVAVKVNITSFLISTIPDALNVHRTPVAALAPPGFASAPELRRRLFDGFRLSGEASFPGT